nr:WD40 repeat domain-containing protein [Micromonospora sp. DSM 115978]
LARPPYPQHSQLQVADSERTTAIVVSPDGRLLAAAAEPGLVQLWHLAEAAEASQAFTALDRAGGVGGAGGVNALTFSGDATLAVGTAAGVVELWDVAVTPARLTRSWVAHHGAVQAMRYLSDRALATVADAPEVKIWGPL